MQTKISLSNLLKLIEGEIASPESVKNIKHHEIEYVGVAPLHLATKDTISFFANEKYLDEAKQTRAGILLCSKKAVPQLSENNVSILISCENPYAAFAKTSQLFFKPTHSFKGISSKALIDETAKIASSATLFPNVFVDSGATVGERSVLYPGCFIGAGSVIGDDCILYPNVVVREGCQIGNRCILNPGAVVGGDGFGFAPTPKENVKIPQIGGVLIEDDVEIGANSAIDRGTIQNTFIGSQTKIDNLVTIGHNAEIGELCLLAGQTGIAGSAKLGKRIVAAGQVGISGHLFVGDNAIIGPQSGVKKNIPPGETWMGSPAKPLKEYIKSMAALSRLIKDKGKKNE